MATLSLRLPESLHRKLTELAKSEGISLNQFLASAAAEKLAALTTESFLADRAARDSTQDVARQLTYAQARAVGLLGRPMLSAPDMGISPPPRTIAVELGYRF